MNFLFILNTFYPNVGGVENATFEICRRLKEKGHNIYVLTTNRVNFKLSRKKLADHEKCDGIHIYRVPYSFRILGLFLKGVFLTRKLQINYICVTDYWGSIALFLKIAFRIPFVYILNGYNPICPTGLLHHQVKCQGFGVLRCLHHCHKLSIRFIISFLIAQRLLNKAQLVIAISKAVQKAFIYYYPNISVELIYYGITVKESIPQKLSILKTNYKIGENEKIILFFGRLIKQRGVVEFIDRFQMIDQEVNCKFIITGFGPESSKIISKVKSLGFQDRVIMTGMLRDQRLFDVINLSDVVILPILFPEPLSLVVLEAMACGKPVVSFALGGVREIITNEKTGFLIQPTNWTQFINTTINLLKNEELCRSIGKAAREEMAQNFKWNGFIEEFLKKILEF
ncbi:MAG: glycosyltransferase family 4 protein [Candidatus Helarchaeota archaeon]